MRTGGSPGGETKVAAFGKLQHIVAFILYVEAFLKYVAVEITEQRAGGSVGGFWIVNLFTVCLVSVSRHPEVIFRIRRVETIVVPVVPNRDRDSIGRVGEKLSRQNFTLAVFADTPPNRRVAPFT